MICPPFRIDRELLGHQQRTTIMGYGNERMPWHPRKAAKAASIEWKSADYGSLTVLALLLGLMVINETGRAFGRWITGTSRNGSTR